MCKVDITGQFSLSTSWASLVQLGGSVGYLALGLGEAAVTGIAFTGSDNVLVLGSGFASSVQTINKAFKSIDASAQNLVGAFRNQPSVSIAQGAGPFDSFFAIPKVKTLLQVNDLVSIANVFDAPGKIPDAYKALVTYRKILSGDTKGLAGLQAFDGLKSIFDSINQLRQLSEPPNSQREQSIEYAWTHNLPTLIELLEAQHAEIGPLKK